MNLYILLPVAAIISGLLLNKAKYGRQIYCVLWGGTLFTVASLRQYTGYDYVLYGNWYNDLINHTLDSLSWYYRAEKGFIVPLKLMRDIGLDARWAFAAIALVITTLLMVYIYKYSERPYISLSCFILFGFFFNSLNFMRQIIAALIICFAYNYIRENRPFRYIALVLLASVFHISALIMLPFYIILKIRMNIITIPLFSGIFIILWFNSEEILRIVTRYIYTAYSNIAGNPEIGRGLPVYYSIAFCIFLIEAVILFCKDKSKKDLYITAMFFGVFFEFIGVKHGVVSRLALYFLIPAIIMLSPQMYIKIKTLIRRKYSENKTRRRIAATLILTVAFMYTGFTYGYFLFKNYNGVVPYNYFFSGRSFEEFEVLRDNAIGGR